MTRNGERVWSPARRDITDNLSERLSMTEAHCSRRSERVKDIAGGEYGRWRVIRFITIRDRVAYWWCRCRCGRGGLISGHHLRSGQSLNCRRCRDRAAGDTHRIHGESGKNRTWEYNSWCSMHSRCSNPAHSRYRNYGGRGISVCERWRSFENFLADMGRCGKGMTLDRRDNDGNYEPGNCRWATARQQVLNRSNAIFLTMGSETMHVSTWSEQVGIPASLLRQRKKAGWSDEKALTTPTAARRHRVG